MDERRAPACGGGGRRAAHFTPGVAGAQARRCELFGPTRVRGTAETEQGRAPKRIVRLRVLADRRAQSCGLLRPALAVPAPDLVERSDAAVALFDSTREDAELARPVVAERGVAPGRWLHARLRVPPARAVPFPGARPLIDRAEVHAAEQHRHGAVGVIGQGVPAADGRPRPLLLHVPPAGAVPGPQIVQAQRALPSEQQDLLACRVIDQGLAVARLGNFSRGGGDFAPREPVPFPGVVESSARTEAAEQYHPTPRGIVRHRVFSTRGRRTRFPRPEPLPARARAGHYRLLVLVESPVGA